MYSLNDLDGKVYDPNDPVQQYCLKKAKCYIDYTVNPPVIRVIQSDDDYEIIGWVWLTNYGELKSNGVDGVKASSDGKYFEYHGKKFPPGVYYLIRKDGREFLVSEKILRNTHSLPNTNTVSVRHSQPTLHFPRTYEIRRFEECLREKFGDSADLIIAHSPSGDLPYDLSVKEVVTESELMNMFMDLRHRVRKDVVKKIEECLSKMDFVDAGNGTFRKRTRDELYADFKCTTVWYQKRREELRGKTVKISELDPDVWLCLKKFNHYEKIDDDTIRVI